MTCNSTARVSGKAGNSAVDELSRSGGPTMRLRGWGIVLLIGVVGLALRLPHLDNRPLHGDEAVHTFKFRELWETGTYRYDPHEFHGPTLYYATWPVMVAVRARDFVHTREWQYRLVTVCFGAAMILLVPLLTDGIGFGAAVFAALLFAVSPAFVFYSRYYIQEPLFAFFTLGMIGSGWRYAKTNSWRMCGVTGVFAGLLVATKETAVLTFAAAAVGLALAKWGTGRETRADTGDGNHRRRFWPLALAVAVAVFVAVVFLSGFFTNMAGPADYLRSYATWLHRAATTALHKHSPLYYLGLLLYTHRAEGPVWSEGLIVALALVGLGVAVLNRRWLPASTDRSLVLFLGGYTVALTGAYSVLPYKTPWCSLTFLLGMVLLAGVGAAAVFRRAPGRRMKRLVVLLLVVGTGQLAWQAYRTSFRYCTDGRNPYVYAQTVPDVTEIPRRLEGLAQVAPEGRSLVIKVFSADAYYWPLPWYLRKFPHVGYWTEVPPDPRAPVVIASPAFEDQLAETLEDDYVMTGYYGLRPKVMLEMWVQFDLWKAYLATRTGRRSSVSQ